ncbi:MAG: peptide methionine sulfoxide reductase [Acidobacteria bacterium]|nr:peptide methionine sulfoxide reductase [Acidobacteriota bacterium]
MKTRFSLVLLILATVFCAKAQPPAAPAAKAALAKATFAGGCFWCMEPPFERLPGVVSVVSGYAGGPKPEPSYEQVSAGGTGHAESVEVTYDPAKVSYAKLLDIYWHNVDPFAVNFQFCDHGAQYRTAIFTHDAEQKRLADESKRALEAKFGKKIATQIVAASRFWPAEEYHQDYYKKNPVRYKFYRFNCGRDQRLTEIWGTAPEH